MYPYIGSSDGFFRRSQITTNNLVNIIAVNIELIIPIERVTANPLMGPVPKLKSNNAAINVVILESRIVVRAPL